MFEKAARIKLRFRCSGNITTEDLWDLNLNTLDVIYGKLRSDQKTQSEDSLLKKATKESSLLNLKIDIVKYIVETKLKEKDAREMRAETKLQREKIDIVIQEKQDEGLRSMSIDDLKKAKEELK